MNRNLIGPHLLFIYSTHGLSNYDFAKSFFLVNPFFCPALPAKWFWIRILGFGQMELDHPQLGLTMSSARLLFDQLQNCDFFFQKIKNKKYKKMARNFVALIDQADYQHRLSHTLNGFQFNPGADSINNFTSATRVKALVSTLTTLYFFRNLRMRPTNQSVCPQKVFQPSLIISSKVRAYPSKVHYKSSTLR